MFDFLDVTRVTQLRIPMQELVDGNMYRMPKLVRVQYSNTPDFFTDVVDMDLLSSQEVTFTEPLMTRYIKLKILEIMPGDEASLPLGVSG